MYVVAMAALLFLAFAYFAVGQAAVARNDAQTAADASALAAARQQRDDAYDAFLAALLAGDDDALSHLLSHVTGPGDPCQAARSYAQQNSADVVGNCQPVDDPPGYTVAIVSKKTVGKSVVKGSENLHAKASATAVVEPRCHVDGKKGHSVDFSCTGGRVSVDPTAADFVLHLSDFYSVHLTK